MARICGVGSVRTLDDVEGEATRVADALVERGVLPGHRVVLKADNSIGWFVALLALMHAETSIVLCSARDTAAGTAALVERVGADLAVVDDDAALPDGLRHCSIYELQLAAATRPAGTALDVEGWAARPDGLIMWSSGSSGTPKAIVKTGASFLRNMDREIAVKEYVTSDVLVPLLPFSHQYGLVSLLIPWRVRCSLVIAPYRRLDHAMRMATLAGATVFDATPATYRSLVNIAASRPATRPALAGARMLCSGAAPLDAGLVGRVRDELGQPLLDSYGTTETGDLSFATVDRPAGCGPALPGMTLRVVDGDGADVAPGEPGELWVESPDLMRGYLDEHGEVVAGPLRGGRWYPTGDFASLDESGTLRILGRARAVHRMGYTLYPEMIERRIADAGCSAKIVPLPDERIGHQLVVFVEDEQGRDAAHWRSELTSLLPSYEMPNRVVVVDRFPLNPNGKPDAGALTELAVSA